MARYVYPVAVLMACASVPSGAGGEPDAVRKAHGVFTGEVKPVLYVADVERSARFFRDVLGFEFDPW